MGKSDAQQEDHELMQQQGSAVYPREGVKIGEYTLVDTLGHGSMATVFLATDATGHEVAFKVFQEGPGVSKTMLERFRREAEASKKLRRHPNIVTIYATGQEPPFHYIVMEKIGRSKTLEAAMESTPMSLETVVHIGIQIAHALQYAHQRNIIHRDVKPSNVMIGEFGEPLLSDFGVAELVDWPSCTMTGALTGTPLYMSPEQARAERVGPATDIYSLGVVLYEALSGVLPYSTHHCSPVREVLEAVKNELPRRPRLFRKEITADLEAVLLKALEKNPERRYPDAESFAIDLGRVADGRRVSARHFTQIDRVRYFARRHHRPLVALSMVLLTGALVGLYYRNKLLNARYESLIWLAQLKSAELMIEQAGKQPGPVAQTTSTWDQIRKARQAMLTSDWTGARNGFRTAADLSRAVGDHRTAAIAHLEMARCETMLGDRKRAEELYRDILINEDTSPAIASLAQIECLSILLLEGTRDEALSILLLRDLPVVGPLRAAIDCLGGDLPPERLLHMMENVPPRFKNDAYMAMALRYNMDHQVKKYVAYLKESYRCSTPSAEWPGPFAKLLYREIIKG